MGLGEEEEDGLSDALSVAFLEASRDGSRGAVACRLAADGEQRDRVLERKKRESSQAGVVDPPIRCSRQEGDCKIVCVCVCVDIDAA